MTNPTTTPTPTNEQQDARFVDFVFSVSSQPPDDAWDEVADLIYHWAEQHGLDVFGIASMRPTTTGANVPAAAATAEREALSGEGLPERFRFSRKVYGDVADDATRVLLALTDGGHADQPSDYLRWVSITAAQALAARPAPVVSGADVEITTAAELDALPAGTIVRDRFGGYLAQGRDAMGVAWFHYPVYDHAGSSALVAGIGPVTVCFTPGLTVADEGRAEA